MKQEMTGIALAAAALVVATGCSVARPVANATTGVVGAAANIDPGQHRGATLANQDGAGAHGFTAVALNAEALGVGIAAVASGACAFLVGHGSGGSASG